MLASISTLLSTILSYSRQQGRTVEPGIKTSPFANTGI